MSELRRRLDALASRPVNYAESTAPPHVLDGWHRDRVTVAIGREAPGPPEEDGLLRTAATLVRTYQFSDPSIVRAAFRYPSDLVGRDMLLEARFLLLRFLLGVRVTSASDEEVGGEHRVAWAYQTLAGHLEQGRLTYELAKDLTSGRVEFRIVAYSRRAPVPNPVLRWGFGLFGRSTQLRFYRTATARLRRLLADPPPPPVPDADGIVRAPSGAEPRRGPVWRIVDPGA